MYFWQKVKTQQQQQEQNKKANIKTLAGAGNWTRELLHPKRMGYHCTNGSRVSGQSLYAVKMNSAVLNKIKLNMFIKHCFKISSNEGFIGQCTLRVL